MPALKRRRAEDTAEVSGQASDKPRGRKPRKVPMRSGKTTELWGFDGLHSD